MSFITADQLLCHAIGDYLLQSHWMATEKTKRSFAAFCHAVSYAIPFYFLNPSWLALATIIVSHFYIDRWRLARFVVFAKNRIAPVDEWATWSFSQPTGYPQDSPAWLTVWLMVIADNILHVICNGLALRFL